jgi:hypothetical protein
MPNSSNVSSFPVFKQRKMVFRLPEQYTIYEFFKQGFTLNSMCQVNVGKFHNKGNCSEKLAEINDVNK